MKLLLSLNLALWALLLGTPWACSLRALYWFLDLYSPFWPQQGVFPVSYVIKLVILPWGHFGSLNI